VLFSIHLTGSPDIPQDILVHIFSFLDMHSLVAAGLVCWSWNSAANDNKLWKMNYSIFFGLSHLSCNNIPVSGVHYSMNSVSDYPSFSWKESFHSKYEECASWKFASNRAFCAHCRSVIWLSNLTCASPHHCPKNRQDEVKLRPLLPDTVSCLTLWWFGPSTSYLLSNLQIVIYNTVKLYILSDQLYKFIHIIISICFPFHRGCMH